MAKMTVYEDNTQYLVLCKVCKRILCTTVGESVTLNLLFINDKNHLTSAKPVQDHINRCNPDIDKLGVWPDGVILYPSFRGKKIK